MTKEKLLQELKYTQKKHQNDHVDAFGTNISLMCADIVNVLNRCVEMSEGVTNGEVLMKMFPQMKLIRCDSSVNMQDENMQYGASFPVDWWNRKWGE